MPRLPLLAALLLLLVASPALASCAAPAALPPSAAAAVARAREVLDEVSVQSKAPQAGYDRSAFGDGWGDADGDGCSTREEVLRRDLTSVRIRDGCTVVAGRLLDPYSGRTIGFERGRGSGDVQIDHVVALANAWQTGAAQWREAQRTAFANDPGELLAVDGGLNQDKGAADAAEWLPPNRGFRCQYVAAQVLIKHRYGLWMTPLEKSATTRVLSRC